MGAGKEEQKSRWGPMRLLLGFLERASHIGSMQELSWLGAKAEVLYAGWEDGCFPHWLP